MIRASGARGPGFKSRLSPLQNIFFFFKVEYLLFFGRTDLEHVEKDVVGVSVVSLGLLLSGYDDSSLGRLLELTADHVKSEIRME